MRAAAVVAYELPLDETLLERVRIYRQIGPFHEVLYGLEIGAREHVEAGLAGIRERIVVAR
jgi:hypothetical protein